MPSLIREFHPTWKWFQHICNDHIKSYSTSLPTILTVMSVQNAIVPHILTISPSSATQSLLLQPPLAHLNEEIGNVFT